MKSSRIRAVDHVVREAAVGLAEALRWFYLEVAGLDDANSQTGDNILRFRSSGLELQIRLLENPTAEVSGFPIVVAIESLEEAAELLRERSVACETISGVSWPDRRLATSDPAGNRVELKRSWPYDPL